MLVEPPQVISPSGPPAALCSISSTIKGYRKLDHIEALLLNFSYKRIVLCSPTSKHDGLSIQTLLTFEIQALLIFLVIASRFLFGEHDFKNSQRRFGEI